MDACLLTHAHAHTYTQMHTHMHKNTLAQMHIHTHTHTHTLAILHTGYALINMSGNTFQENISNQTTNNKQIPSSDNLTEIFTKLLTAYTCTCCRYILKCRHGKNTTTDTLSQTETEWNLLHLKIHFIWTLIFSALLQHPLPPTKNVTDW